MSRSIALVDDPAFDQHVAPYGHPERAERLAAAREGIRHALADQKPIVIAAREASHSELIATHSGAYVNVLEQRLRAAQGPLDPDTYVSAGTREAAWKAAGGTVDLVAALWEKRADSGISLVRPPGHHAERDRAMGFCMLNNVAIGAQALLTKGAQRVAIVDWDVHHGNGTQHAFYDDPRVLFISLHQWPFYPGTGALEEIGSGAGTGFNANVPLAAGSGPDDYGYAFQHVVAPLLRAFRPEAILVSAGFDAHRSDPLAGMHLDAASYAAMATTLLDLADESAQGRIGWVFEGGYDLNALADSWAAVVRAVGGTRVALPAGKPNPHTERTVSRVRGVLCQRWPELT